MPTVKDTPPELANVVTVAEAAKVLMITPHHVRQLIRAGRLTPLRADPFLLDRRAVQAYRDARRR